MGKWSSALRLGTTSAVYPDDLLPNVRRLAGLVQDVEWVVFEVAYGLPGPGVVAEMARLGRGYGHSYTVHLPLDLALAAADDSARQASVETARRVIAAARPLDPWAYVVHLEPGGDETLQLSAWTPWHGRAERSLQALAAAAGHAGLLAVENLPEYPAGRLSPLLDRLPLSLCLDVGHLLRQGTDPRPLLAQQLGRARAVHLHGVEGGRDHQSLAAMDQGLLLQLLRTLWQERFGGVVTIEVFDADRFCESWDLVDALWRQVQE
jgi:sugar phosphate isomerase/epimerase